MAAQAAIASPLLEAGAIDGARGILINVTGSSSLKLHEVNEASTIIQNAAHEDANIIFGAVQDERMKDEVKITVIATGFKTDHAERRERAVSAAAAAISQARTASSYVSRAEAQAADYPSKPTSGFHPNAASALGTPGLPGTPAATAPSPTVAPRPAPQRDTASIADVKSTVKTSYEEDDLDVPAFIRKRNEGR